MREMTPLEKTIEREINIDRMLLFLEEKGGFRQVILTKEQFKKVSDASVRKAGKADKHGMQKCFLELNHDRPLIPKEHFEFMSDYDEQD